MCRFVLLTDYRANKNTTPVCLCKGYATATWACVRYWLEHGLVSVECRHYNQHHSERRLIADKCILRKKHSECWIAMRRAAFEKHDRDLHKCPLLFDDIVVNDDMDVILCTLWPAPDNVHWPPTSKKYAHLNNNDVPPDLSEGICALAIFMDKWESEDEKLAALQRWTAYKFAWTDFDERPWYHISHYLQSMACLVDKHGNELPFFSDVRVQQLPRPTGIPRTQLERVPRVEDAAFYEDGVFYRKVVVSAVSAGDSPTLQIGTHKI